MASTITIPAMLDPHVHLRGLDWAHKGTFASETAAALAGGYWAVLDMPNTPPSTVDLPALEVKLAIGREAVCDWCTSAPASRTTPRLSRSGGPRLRLKIYNNATTGDLLIEARPAAPRIPRLAAPPDYRVHAEGGTVADILALV